MFVDIFGCHNLGGQGSCASGIWWVEARAAAKHPTTHRTAPQQRVIQPPASIAPLLRSSDLHAIPLVTKVSFFCLPLETWLGCYELVN